MKKLYYLSFLLIGANLFAKGENKKYAFFVSDCRVELRNDTLAMENSEIRRTWLWNNGNLITVEIENKKNPFHWKATNKEPDLALPGELSNATDATISAQLIPDSYQYVKHIRTTIQYSIGDLQVKKIFKLYPACPAIACELYLKGKASGIWFKTVSNPADLQNIEKLTESSEAGKVTVMEQLSLPGKHWKVQVTEFLDITDRFNNLVLPVKVLTYRDCLYRGNLLFAENMEDGTGFFMLKEAPTSNVQLYYPHGDYLLNQGSFRMIGLGVDSLDIQPDKWCKAYGYVTGVFRGTETDKLLALRNYQHRVRPLLPERDEMVLLNTWGDRGQDTRVNEAFCLKELQLASRLGVTHFQIDDGWQAGRSANSAFGGTFKNIWSNPDYWKPDPGRFPNGLTPLVKKGKELGIEICLWFNPSIQNSYADWEKDAEALIYLYKTYGIRTFKIDGTSIPDKLSEVRLRNLYERVMAATEWRAVLNLDATAGRRGGYFYFNEFGNIFLENRYTDWQNYYPYRTLRNLWMLSGSVPPQLLQIEFLNKWRNQDKYAGDRFAPANYSFDYLFAITMAAQPLAWFEAANLPEEAFATGEVIKKYRQIQHDFHQGYILPIGNEPDGKSWCGFQSIKEDGGYILVFREDNELASHMISTCLNPNKKVLFTKILGDGESFEGQVTSAGMISFSLGKANSFALYHYQYK